MNLMQTVAHINNVSDQEQKKYNSLLEATLATFTRELRRGSPHMDQLFRNIYYSGSYFDGLKVGKSGQEFDLNLVLNISRNKVRILDLGSDLRKPNFAHLAFDGVPNEAERTILVNSAYGTTLSPDKMCSLLRSAGDRALMVMQNKIRHDCSVYRVTRAVNAPYTLIISGNGMSMEVDLVPAVELSIDQLPANSKVMTRLTQISQARGLNFRSTNFMAICLWKADKDRFEIDFHDLEREILQLTYPNVVKPIIRMLKAMRDYKGGSFVNLWSHLIKTSVMHTVLAHRQPGFWSERFVAERFQLCLRELHERLVAKHIPDLFFLEYNMVSRLLKKGQALEDATRFFGNALRKLDRCSSSPRELEVAISQLVLGTATS